MDEYIKDLGKTIPSMEGKHDKNKEYERLSIVYVTDGSEPSDDSGDDDSGDDDDSGISKVLVQVVNNQGAVVKINGTERTSTNVNKGSNVIITIEKEGYRIKTKTINNIQEATVETLEFTDDDRLQFDINLSSNIPNTTFTINGVETNNAKVYYGGDAVITAKVSGYKQKTQTITNIKENKNITIQFTEDDRITVKHNVTVNINEDYNTCTINNQNVTSLDVYEGDDVSILVTKYGYEDKVDIILNITKDEVVEIEFTDDDKIRFTLTPSCNIEGVTIKAYDENDNELTLTNGSITIDYGDYIKFVATSNDYNTKEIVYPSVIQQENPTFTFTDDDLKPVFRVSQDGVNWQKFINLPIEIGSYEFLFKRADNTQTVKLRTGNGYVESHGASGNISFSEENGFKKCTINITSVGDQIGIVGFEFANDNNGDTSTYGYVGIYFEHQ